MTPGPVRVASMLAVAAVATVATVAWLPFGAGADGVSTLAPEAERVLAEAAAARADLRAPVTWDLAREAYARGLLARRREELAPGPLRDYRVAAAEFARAIGRGAEATRLARTWDRRMRARSDEVVSRARIVLAEMEGIELLVGMQDATRRRLQAARALTSEAEHLLASGSLEVSVDVAVEAHRAAVDVAAELAGLAGRYAEPAHRALWSDWAVEAVEWSRRTGRTAVIVSKDEHRLTVYRNGRALRSFLAELGWNNLPDKRRQGDGATPEGRYRIVDRKGPGRTRFHRALLLDYPNAADRTEFSAAVRRGEMPPHARPGGLIEIHGDGGRGRDWTDGCVALGNADMDVLYALVEEGTPVVIVGTLEGSGPFSGIAGRLAR